MLTSSQSQDFAETQTNTMSKKASGLWAPFLSSYEFIVWALTIDWPALTRDEGLVPQQVKLDSIESSLFVR